jgi:ABC-type antimicrobial peptide transport system permease subunit
VLRDGLALTLAGVTVGLIGARFAAGAASALLYGGSPLAPLPYLIAVTLIAVSSATALWLPARRASGVNPVTALSAE